MGTKLQRVHSMTKRPVSMGDADVHAVMHELERNLCDEGLGASPQLRACIMGDGWLPIASLINYTPLGNAVWPFGGMGVVADCLCTHGSMEVELSGDRACVRKKPLRVRLREQLEFIYADRNYCKDLHLQLLEDKEGFASLDMVCSTYTASRMLLQAVASPAACAALLREALDSSSELVHRQPAASEDGSGWVRRMSLVEKVTSQVEYYLNPARMAADQFLIEQAEENGGYVNIATLLSFPRLRKLVSPQIAAVAHVLSKSPKLEVSPNSALVRPRSKPPESPARAVLPANARAQVLYAVERVLNDASLIHDTQLQAAIAAHSPASALRSGGLGVRVPVEDVVLHPEVESALPSSSASLLQSLRQARDNPSDPAAAAASALIRRKLSELLPREGESALVRLSTDYRYFERLRPTPEVRQLVPAAGFAGVPASGASDTLSSSAAHTAAGASSLPGSAHFSVLTYNILADMLSTCEQFPAVRVDVLDWSYRRELVLKELAFHAPDVLCLQELQGMATCERGVDGDHHADLADALGARGYAHAYVRKVRRDGTGWPSAQLGNGIFWKTATFQLIEAEEVPIAPRLCAACVDEQSRAHFGRGAQVGLVLALRHLRNGRTVVVATTHLSCNFQEPVTQVAQVHVVAAATLALAAKHGPSTAIVLGADLNSLPGSGVFCLLQQGTLPAAHAHMSLQADGVSFPDFGALGGGGRELRLPMRLKSAYTAVLGQEPLFTNFTGPPSNFVGTLDYLWFAGSGLAPTHVLQLPSEEAVREERCLPSSRFPSDHLPLLACFRLRDSPLDEEPLALPHALPHALPRLPHATPPGFVPKIRWSLDPLAMGEGQGEEGEEAMAEDMLISPKRSRDGELLGRQAASPVPMSVATPRAEEVLPAALMNPHNKPFAWGRGGGGAVSGGAAGSAAAGFPRPGSAGQARGGGDRFRARAGGSREGSPALRATPGHLPGGDGRQGTPQGGHRRGAADVEAGGRGSSGRDRGGRRSGGRGGAPPSLSTEKQLFNENN